MLNKEDCDINKNNRLSTGAEMLVFDAANIDSDDVINENEEGHVAADKHDKHFKGAGGDGDDDDSALEQPQDVSFDELP